MALTILRSLISVVALTWCASTIAHAQEMLDPMVNSDAVDEPASIKTYTDTSQITGAYCKEADPEIIEALNIDWAKTDTIAEKLTVSISQKKRVNFSCGRVGCTLQTRKHPKIYIRTVTDDDVTTYYDARGRATILLLNELMTDLPDGVAALVGCTTA